MDIELKHLFSPVRIGNLELKNRAVMPAMATGYSNADSTVSDRQVAYLARRARGGVGLIITEVCAIDPRGRGFANEMGSWSDEFIPGLKKIADAIHREGGRAAVQLHHAGRETFEATTGAMPEAPSPIPSAILQQPCEEMSLARIAQVVEAYARAAGRVKRAGFDAAEIHGAHGYLLTQFLSPFSNKRSDRYGGSEENRTRIVLEVIEAARAEVGADFPLIIRISAEEMIRDGYDLDFIKRIAPKLVAAGADAIHASVGVYSTPGNLSIASADTEVGFNLFRARAVKSSVKVPVIGVGRIADPRIADRAIAEGDADLVAFGRQHLADPDFLQKARRGDYDEIRWCVACNQGCIERLSYEMKSATCTFNPDCGQEYRGEIAKAEQPKKVLVVGSGPAGMTAALYAAKRGHAVSIYEREAEPCGQIKSASRPPHKQGLMQWAKWSLRQLARENVRITCGVEVDEALIDGVKPDVAILAAGALPSLPPIPGIEGKNVVGARDLLEGKAEIREPAVVLGAGYVGMETADYLLQKVRSVTVLEMEHSAPVGNHTARGYWLHRRLRKAGAHLILGARVVRVEPDAVICQHEGAEKRHPAAMVVTALGVKPERALEEALKRLNMPYVTVGDAKSPRRLIEAIYEGARAGKEI
jgi:2,4-dienoyl-CoA reductase-like NADH-dependent reductase (Old Yellow Enzyme family)/thioredoxin reductase